MHVSNTNTIILAWGSYVKYIQFSTNIFCFKKKVKEVNRLKTGFDRRFRVKLVGQGIELGIELVKHYIPIFGTRKWTSFSCELALNHLGQADFQSEPAPVAHPW